MALQLRATRPLRPLIPRPTPVIGGGLPDSKASRHQEEADHTNRAKDANFAQIVGKEGRQRGHSLVHRKQADGHHKQSTRVPHDAEDGVAAAQLRHLERIVQQGTSQIHQQLHTDLNDDGRGQQQPHQQGGGLPVGGGLWQQPGQNHHAAHA